MPRRSPHLGRSRSQTPPPLLAFASALAWLLWVGASQAQPDAANPDWREEPAPPPPAFEVSHLIPFEVEAAASELRFGIDPTTLRIGPDGVVLHVVVARGGGALNAMYQGIRCATAEYKVYARYHPDSGWRPVPAPTWRPMHETAYNRYALALARQGLCQDNAPPPSVQDILRGLRGQQGLTTK